MGLITVGPVTTRIAPATAAVGHERPASVCPSQVVAPKVITSPPVTMSHSGQPSLRASDHFSERPPSNRITATPRDTRGDSRSPNSSDGFTSPRIGPASSPVPSSSTMAGMRRREAHHWAATPATSRPARR